jgi:chromosome segregation ATPase
MIDEEDYSSFKFEGNDEPDSERTVYQEEAKDRRLEKLGHRVTIISILIPVLIGVIFYMAYRDITSRVSRSQDTGAMEIQNLSAQLEENFARLTAKYGELESALTQKLADLEKVDQAMKTNLKQAEEAVADINATKADKADQQQTIAKIDSALIPIRQELKDIQSMTTGLQTQNNDLKQQLAALSSNLATLSADTDKSLKELAAIQTDLTALSDQKMNKDALQLELLKARKGFQRDLDVAKVAIDKRLESMLRQIKDLEKTARAPLSTPRPSGSIVEQEIKE